MIITIKGLTNLGGSDCKDWETYDWIIFLLHFVLTLGLYIIGLLVSLFVNNDEGCNGLYYLLIVYVVVYLMFFFVILAGTCICQNYPQPEPYSEIPQNDYTPETPQPNELMNTL